MDENKDYVLIESHTGADSNEIPGSDRIINGEPLFFSTGQVADRLDENDSTIRYWCDEFDAFIKIDRTGKAGKKRVFTAIDIKKLEYIKYLLKQENLSVKQVKEYLSTKEAKLMMPITKEKEQLMIEAISKIVSVEIEKQNREFEDRFIDALEQRMLNSSQIQLKVITDQVNEVFNGAKDEFKIIMESYGEIKKINDELMKQNTAMQQKLEDMGKKIEPKGFFSRIFHRHS